MPQTISKHIGEGFGKGELYAVLAYNTSDTFGGMRIKGISFSPVVGIPAIQIGDLTTAWTALHTDKAISIYSTCASTNASTSFEPVLFHTTLTGAGQVGGRVKAFMTTNVALGAWSNALKAEVTYGASGKTEGLGSVFCAEMTLSAGCTAIGTYAPLEIELNLGTGALTGDFTSLFYLSINGADKATFDTNGYLLNLQGVTVASGKIFQANTAAAATHALRIRIGGNPYYIMLTNVGA